MTNFELRRAVLDLMPKISSNSYATQVKLRAELFLKEESSQFQNII